MTLSNRPTIADVAARARVSRTSVSRVLNGRGELTRETVQRVLTAIDDLGYRPNEVARSLSFQRTRTIGMIVYDILNPGMAECVYTAQEELARRDYRVILTCMGGHLETGRACLSMLEDWRVDAVITAALLDQTGSDGGRPLPFIPKDGVQCYDPLNGRVSLVKFDEVAGGYQAASHLLALGHRQIGIVAGPSYWGAVEERIDGYARAFADRGLAIEPLSVEDAPEWTIPAGYAATLRLLDRTPDLTAIWALYDVLAIGVVRALHDRGKRIPEDVAVIGFNDEGLASYTSPR
ncbi:MAG: LacI family DNA-binding transcriptional regulator, partial [Chloroflexota bacterium]